MALHKRTQGTEKNSAATIVKTFLVDYSNYVNPESLIIASFSQQFDLVDLMLRKYVNGESIHSNENEEQAIYFAAITASSSEFGKNVIQQICEMKKSILSNSDLSTVRIDPVKLDTVLQACLCVSVSFNISSIVKILLAADIDPQRSANAEQIVTGFKQKLYYCDMSYSVRHILELLTNYKLTAFHMACFKGTSAICSQLMNHIGKESFIIFANVTYISELPYLAAVVGNLETFVLLEDIGVNINGTIDLNRRNVLPLCVRTDSALHCALERQHVKLAGHIMKKEIHQSNIVSLLAKLRNKQRTILLNLLDEHYVSQELSNEDKFGLFPNDYADALGIPYLKIKNSNGPTSLFPSLCGWFHNLMMAGVQKYNMIEESHIVAFRPSIRHGYYYSDKIYEMMEFLRALIIAGCDEEASYIIDSIRAHVKMSLFDFEIGLPWLHLAAKNGCVKCLDLLLQCDTENKQLDKVYEKGTPLYYSLLNGHVDCSLILLRHKAHAIDVHCGGNELHLSVRSQNSELVKIVSEYDIDTNAEDIQGITPAGYAGALGNGKIINILLKPPMTSSSLKCECDMDFRCSACLLKMGFGWFRRHLLLNEDLTLHNVIPKLNSSIEESVKYIDKKVEWIKKLVGYNMVTTVLKLTGVKGNVVDYLLLKAPFSTVVKVDGSLLIDWIKTEGLFIDQSTITELFIAAAYYGKTDIIEYMIEHFQSQCIQDSQVTYETSLAFGHYTTANILRARFSDKFLYSDASSPLVKLKDLPEALPLRCQWFIGITSPGDDKWNASIDCEIGLSYPDAWLIASNEISYFQVVNSEIDDRVYNSYTTFDTDFSQLSPSFERNNISKMVYQSSLCLGRVVGYIKRRGLSTEKIIWTEVSSHARASITYSDATKTVVDSIRVLTLETEDNHNIPALDFYNEIDSQTIDTLMKQKIIQETLPLLKKRILELTGKNIDIHINWSSIDSIKDQEKQISVLRTLSLHEPNTEWGFAGLGTTIHACHRMLQTLSTEFSNSLTDYDFLMKHLDTLKTINISYAPPTSSLGSIKQAFSQAECNWKFSHSGDTVQYNAWSLSWYVITRLVFLKVLLFSYPKYKCESVNIDWMSFTGSCFNVETLLQNDLCHLYHNISSTFELSKYDQEYTKMKISVSPKDKDSIKIAKGDISVTVHTNSIGKLSNMEDATSKILIDWHKEKVNEMSTVAEKILSSALAEKENSLLETFGVNVKLTIEKGIVSTMFLEQVDNFGISDYDAELFVNTSLHVPSIVAEIHNLFARSFISILQTMSAWIWYYSRLQKNKNRKIDQSLPVFGFWRYTRDMHAVHSNNVLVMYGEDFSHSTIKYLPKERVVDSKVLCLWTFVTPQEVIEGDFTEQNDDITLCSYKNTLYRVIGRKGAMLIIKSLPKEIMIRSKNDNEESNERLELELSISSSMVHCNLKKEVSFKPHSAVQFILEKARLIEEELFTCHTVHSRHYVFIQFDYNGFENICSVEPLHLLLETLSNVIHTLSNNSLCDRHGSKKENYGLIILERHAATDNSKIISFVEKKKKNTLCIKYTQEKLILMENGLLETELHVFLLCKKHLLDFLQDVLYFQIGYEDINIDISKFEDMNPNTCIDAIYQACQDITTGLLFISKLPSLTGKLPILIKKITICLTEGVSDCNFTDKHITYKKNLKQSYEASSITKKLCQCILDKPTPSDIEALTKLPFSEQCLYILKIFDNSTKKSGNRKVHVKVCNVYGKSVSLEKIPQVKVQIRLVYLARLLHDRTRTLFPLKEHWFNDINLNHENDITSITWDAPYENISAGSINKTVAYKVYIDDMPMVGNIPHMFGTFFLQHTCNVNEVGKSTPKINISRSAKLNNCQTSKMLDVVSVAKYSKRELQKSSSPTTHVRLIPLIGSFINVVKCHNFSQLADVDIEFYCAKCQTKIDAFHRSDDNVKSIENIHLDTTLYPDIASMVDLSKTRLLYHNLEMVTALVDNGAQEKMSFQLFDHGCRTINLTFPSIGSFLEDVSFTLTQKDPKLTKSEICKHNVSILGGKKGMIDVTTAPLLYENPNIIVQFKDDKLNFRIPFIIRNNRNKSPTIGESPKKLYQKNLEHFLNVIDGVKEEVSLVYQSRPYYSPMYYDGYYLQRWPRCSPTYYRSYWRN